MELIEFSILNSQFLILIILFFLIALVYSSVGFGGGSSYLALLAITGISFQHIRPVSLLCNIIVVMGSCVIFFRSGHLNLKRAWPLIISSIPLAFIGGLWPIKQTAFFILLGTTLVIASLILWIQPARENQSTSSHLDSTPLKLVLGGGLGLLSGLVGIGGGIFLSPILHFMRWDSAHKISAVASFFILVNSISGLIGYSQQSTPIPWDLAWPLLIAVLLGGQLGARLGATQLKVLYIKRITAFVILIAGVKILTDTL
jgi:uncharacterized membrane protein YfcA